MNRICCFVAVVCLMFFSVSCGVTGTGNEGERETSVASAVKNKDVSIVVNYIYPTTMSPRSTMDGYTLNVKGGKLNGFLPFFGTSTSGGYSPNDGGFNFDDCPVTIREKKSKDKVEWRFEAVSGTEKAKITVTVWNNGTAEIYIQSNTKSPIRYSGEIE